MRFQGKRILLGVTGGIAAYKTLSLVRLLRAEGADVRVLLTHGAEIMAGRGAFEALSGHPVAENVFAPVESPEFSSVAHIELARWADLLLIAPCTAHTLAKLAAGEADTLLTLVYLATNAPRLVAPSMNCAMLGSPAVQRNIRQAGGIQHSQSIRSSQLSGMRCAETSASFCRVSIGEKKHPLRLIWLNRRQPRTFNRTCKQMTVQFIII